MSETTGGAAAPKRRRWKCRGAEAWRALIERQRTSGVSIRTFCEAEGISRGSFDRWCAQLGLQGAGRKTGARRSATPSGGFAAPDTDAQGEPPVFLDAGALRLSAAEPVEVRLDLGGGLVLTIRRG